MAIQQHVDLLKEGVGVWNQWRRENPDRIPDLSGIDIMPEQVPQGPGGRILRQNYSNINFKGVDLTGASFFMAIFSNAHFDGAKMEKISLADCYLGGVYFNNANLTGAIFNGSELNHADFTNAILVNSSFVQTSMWLTDFSNADLRNSDFERAMLVEAVLKGANISGSRIYGISAWNIVTDEHTLQSDLIITLKNEPTIAVDNIKIAQFLYLLLNNTEISDAINTISRKAVLILGNFERMQMLKQIAEYIRSCGYLPIIFNFDKPLHRTTVETIITLAGLSLFVIADVTAPRSIIGELHTIVPIFPSVPVHPLLEKNERVWGMFDSILAYPAVKPIREYSDVNELDNHLSEIHFITKELRGDAKVS